MIHMELDCWFSENNRLLFVFGFIIFDFMHIWGLDEVFYVFPKSSSITHHW
jgi:hypothetical protein